MERVKYLIFGLRNLLIQAGQDERSGTGIFDTPIAEEFGKLIRFARSRDIQPVVFANHKWTLDDGTTVEKPLNDKWGQLQWLTANGTSLPFKPQAEAMQAVLNRLSCKPNEVLYIGNTERDMQTAVNGGVLFLNATWITDDIKYGFKFSTPRDIARFIDSFCCRSKAWAFEIDSGSLHYRSLAPFSTFKQEYESYSSSARNTKDGWGDPEFWGRYICATLLLTGLHNEFDYVCPFPRHEANKWNEPLRASIETFAKCFRKRYIPDLIIRHTSTLSSRKNPDKLMFTDHLSSIVLNPKPIKNVSTQERYVNPPLKTGKRVMVVDDFCTRGRSIEAARIYLERLGCKVVLLSWLKTINRDYTQITSTGSFNFNPYKPTDWRNARLSTTNHPYSVAMTDDEAHSELDKKFKAYRDWDWPAGL